MKPLTQMRAIDYSVYIGQTFIDCKFGLSTVHEYNSKTKEFTITYAGGTFTKPNFYIHCLLQLV